LPLVLRDINDAKKEVYSRKTIFLALADLDTEKGRQILHLLNRLETAFRNYMSFAILHVEGCEPSVSLFLEGREILRQDSFFGNTEKDYNALRMSLWSILKDYNLDREKLH